MLILAGSKVSGQEARAFFAVHVLSRSPVRPWTKIILILRKTLADQFPVLKAPDVACVKSTITDLLDDAALPFIEQLNSGRERFPC